MDAEREIRGVWTRGEEPKELVLSDGSRLCLRAAEEGRVEWARAEMQDDNGDGVAARPLSVPQAMELAGEDFGGYVTVRTRTEAAWLRAVSDWCCAEAGRLESELATAS